jgi:hypothetical protein
MPGVGPMLAVGMDQIDCDTPRLPGQCEGSGSETVAISKRATVFWWLSVSQYVRRFRPKAKAREPLASLPFPRPQDVRRSAIATRSHADPRTGA